MYIILIAIFAAIVGSALLFWVVKADIPVSTTVERLTVTLLLIAILIGGFWVGCACNATNKQATFSDEYNQLKLYQYTVETSDNEYLRFDYYNRVQEWNEKYDTYTKLESNSWVSWFLFEPMKYCGRIDFELHGDEVTADVH